MKKLYLLTATALFSVTSAYSQCAMIEVPLTERIAASQSIIEGKVVDRVSFWNTEHTHIFTANTIEVYKVLKGNAIASQIELVTEGGTVGTDMEIVTPTLELSEGLAGMFFLKASEVTNSATGMSSDLKFQPTADIQSFVKYDMVDQIGTDMFKTYTDISAQLYNVISTQAGKAYQTIKPFDIHQPKSASAKINAASISSFSPTTITAGTSSTLTINGTGFGTTKGKVEFKNADDGGASYIAPNATTNITSWTDTQIQVIVPSYGSCHAGTGIIRVTPSGGSAVTSGSSLTVTYGQTTTNDGTAEWRLKLANINSSGGYSLIYSNSFTANAPAVAAFERALVTWKCASYINFVRSGTTTSVNCTANDGSSIVSFDTGCPLGGSLLGKTFSYYTACSKSSVWYWIQNEFDIVFATAAGGQTWNFGPGATSGGKQDFESTCLHELAHAQLEAHVINIPKLMHWSRNSNTDVRTLDPAIDLACVNDNISRSSTSNPCGKTMHVKVSAATCSVIGVNELSDYSKYVSIYPNPFSSTATLHIDAYLLSSAGNITFNLYDMLGNQVRAVTNINTENYEIESSGLSNGVYFYRLKSANQILTSGKLVLTGDK